MPRIPRAASLWCRLIGIALGVMVSKPCDLVVTRARCCVFGLSTIFQATLTTLQAASWYRFRSTTCAGMCDTVFDISVSCRVCLYGSIATGCGCQKFVLFYGEKNLRMNCPMTEVAGKDSTARRGNTLNHMRVFSLPMRKCKRINPLGCSGCLVAAGSCGRFLRSTRLVQLVGIIDEQLRLMLAS